MKISKTHIIGFLTFIAFQLNGMAPLNELRDSFPTSILFHEFHISRTTLNYDSKTKAYQMTVHIFIDDLEKCLLRKGHKNLRIGSEKELATTDEIIEKYLRENLILMSAKAIPYTFLGRELSEDATALYCYLESGETPSLVSLGIKNSLLLEEFQDQKNIIDVTRDKKRITQVLCQKGEEYKLFEM
jgi:hypothetical protein